MKYYSRRILTDQEMKEAWRKHFPEERKRIGTQEEFAKAMEAAGLKTTQTTVGRWEHVGDRYGSEIPGFPDFSTMQVISKVLGVQIGFLIGESPAKSFEMSETMEFLSLPEEAVAALIELASKKPAGWSRFDEKYDVEGVSFAETLERLLVNPEFQTFVAHLNEMDNLVANFERSSSSESRSLIAALKEERHCRKFALHPDRNSERFDEEGHLLDEDGRRMFDPNDRDAVCGKVFRVRDESRKLRYLLAEDQAAIAHSLWPQIAEYEKGVVDLVDIIAHIDTEDPYVEVKTA